MKKYITEYIEDKIFDLYAFNFNYAKTYLNASLDDFSFLNYLDQTGESIEYLKLEHSPEDILGAYLKWLDPLLLGAFSSVLSFTTSKYFSLYSLFMKDKAEDVIEEAVLACDTLIAGYRRQLIQNAANELQPHYENISVEEYH